MPSVIRGDPVKTLHVARKGQQIVEVQGRHNYSRQVNGLYLPPKYGQQIVQVYAPPPCAEFWQGWVDLDIRFAETYTGLDPLRDRIILTLKSASGNPVAMCSGADVHLLAEWDSPTPANFGGDGHGWWAVYYIVPTDTDIDFAGTTGASRIANFFTCLSDIPTSGGTHGDGVDITFAHDLDYEASFGVATASVDVSQEVEPLEAAFLWAGPEVRTIDDIVLTREFHFPSDGSIFDDDMTTHNIGIPEQDAYLDGRDLHEEAATAVMSFTTTATADVFPGSCRCISWAFSAVLRATCPE